jgi:hypothetical protein
MAGFLPMVGTLTAEVGEFSRLILRNMSRFTFSTRRNHLIGSPAFIRNNKF